MRASSPRKNKGITLVELLVILAIIAALAAMMYPVLMQAKDTARMTMCSSNLRQLGSAFRMYADDNSGYPLLPHPQVIITRNPTYILYVEPLLPYISQQQGSYGLTVKQSQIKKIWVCPGDVGTGQWQSVWSKYGSSYRYPDFNGYVTVAGAFVIPHKLEKWKKPTVTPLFADHRSYYHRSVEPNANALPEDPKVTPQDGPGGIDAALVKSINMLMLDMHVIAISETQLNQYLNNIFKEGLHGP